MTDLKVLNSVKLYLVGGWVRDQLLGVASKDVDYAVEVPADHAGQGFSIMRDWLTVRGYDIFQERPEFFTIRARRPATERGMKGMEKIDTADFVLCRKDSATSDGRRPDSVEVGTIFDDLARRDFTVNAMALTLDNELLDPHGGQRDLINTRLRAVGGPVTRFREDYLRAMRAVRFCITKGFILDHELWSALNTDEVARGLRTIPVDRRRDEMFKALHHNTPATLDFLYTQIVNSDVRAAMLEGMWLKPTSEQ